MDVIKKKDGTTSVVNAGKISQRSMRKQKSRFFHPMMLVQYLTENKKPIHEGIQAAFVDICRESPTYFEFFNDKNTTRNRNQKTLLNDYSRVVLTEPSGGDYYHASYVDGLSTPKQYVLAQAPFSKETEADFHRLVSQLKPEVIVMLMNEESNEGKSVCPEGKGEKTCGGIKFKVEEENKSKYRHVKLAVSGGKSGVSKANVFYMSTWTDDKKLPGDLMEFKEFVQKKCPTVPAREAASLVICKNGAKRSGVWYIMETETERLETKKRIRFSESIRQLRYQRYGALDCFELYTGLIDIMQKVASKYV
ncbi:unnamed protein product [Bursaphelenchus okinawaensis]|uniref:Tyrosine-protein phosphatase domain-containing protein n=1 Tax=Bursaphelenchus okinawaensis TaxID=465554 RepID=A0A811L842_9BILA|nr:unnamed protein product [Bursaphelenchus okinawaensis]CAG9118513.1 unnamed protein product [Bursaphelenchus okinawaensis]